VLTAYLGLNALLYAVLAAWCSLRPEQTARSLGYVELNNAGRAEYLAIYGGLQLGLAAVFGALALSPGLRVLGAQFAVALYAPIVIQRLVAMLRLRPASAVTRSIASLEVLLLLGALLLVAAAA
jgi:hypothetical protein